MEISLSKLSEVEITRAIVDTYMNSLLDNLELDVAVAGGGPAGLTAARELALRGHKVALFDRKLSPGGGMWGGGMGFNVIVVQEEGRSILEELGVRTSLYSPGYYTASSVESITTLIAEACRAGVSLFNLFSVEDVMVDLDRIAGVVVTSSPIEIAGLHVDPVCFSAKYVIEATGHPLEVLHTVIEKTGFTLSTPSGGIEGEKSMNADMGEMALAENTIEIVPGLFVAGMAANAAMGAHRMGPVFGGMLLSGKIAAEKIHTLLIEN